MTHHRALVILVLFHVAPATNPTASSPASPSHTAAPVAIDEKEQKEKVKVLITNELSSQQCAQVVQSQLTDDVTLAEGCKLLERSKTVFETLNCTVDDYSKLHKAVCTTTVDSTPRETRVRAAVEGLSNRCKLLMRTDVQVLSKPSTEFCQILQKRKDYLIRVGLCTNLDYAKLYHIVCSNSDSNADLSEQDRRKDQALSIMKNNLTDSCHKSLWPQAENFAEGLGTVCNYLKIRKSTLVSNGVCTLEDYRKLEPVICPLPMSEEEKAQRAEIERIVASDVTSTCKATMGPQLEAQKSQPLEKSCELFKSSKDTLISGGLCTKSDVGKLEPAICTGEGNSVAGGIFVVLSMYFLSQVLV